MTFADIATGHTDIADWLYLIAAILFVLAGLIKMTQRPDPSAGALIPAGLALVAIALLVT
jgi:hypothetical protein